MTSLNRSLWKLTSTKCSLEVRLGSNWARWRSVHFCRCFLVWKMFESSLGGKILLWGWRRNETLRRMKTRTIMRIGVSLTVGAFTGNSCQQLSSVVRGQRDNKLRTSIASQISCFAHLNRRQNIWYSFLWWENMWSGSFKHVCVRSFSSWQDILFLYLVIVSNNSLYYQPLHCLNWRARSFYFHNLCWHQPDYDFWDEEVEWRRWLGDLKSPHWNKHAVIVVVLLTWKSQITIFICQKSYHM